MPRELLLDFDNKFFQNKNKNIDLEINKFYFIFPIVYINIHLCKIPST